MQHIHLPWTFCEDLTNDYVLSEEAFRHLFHVLRITNGAEIVSFDGRGKLRLGRLQLAKKIGCVAFTESVSVIPAPERTFNLVQCLPNNIATFDDILRKACELGIQNIYPVLSERSEKSAWRSELWSKRQERFQRILQESCKQAKNPFLPQLHAIELLSEIKNFSIGHCFFGSLESSHNVFLGHNSEATIACIVGPEGGFSSQEENFLKRFATPLQLPTCVMRVETAVVALLTVLKTGR